MENQKNKIEELERLTGRSLEIHAGKPYYSGSLDLEGCTGITSLPEGLTVGGSLDLGGTGITSIENVRRELTAEQRQLIAKQRNVIPAWEWNGKTYIKIDGIFSVVDSHKGNVWHVHQIGSNKKSFIVSDGERHYAHGDTLQEARADLIYKINDRDTTVYKQMSLDDELTFEEAIVAYRTITGACSAGTRDYIENRLPKPRKEKYTIREIIELTRGEYKSETFRRFFSEQ